MDTRLSDENLNSWIEDYFTDPKTRSALVELRDRRAAEAKAWHLRRHNRQLRCVRLLFRMIDQKDWYNDAIPDDVRRAAREVGIDLTD